jgi:hypothetical protein
MPLVNRALAEFLGTFMLVFGGCGSAVLAAAFPGVGIGLLGVALAFGLTVLTMAYAVGRVSGGHFNPAVTVGLFTAETNSSCRYHSLHPRAGFWCDRCSGSAGCNRDWKAGFQCGCEWTGCEWFR